MAAPEPVVLISQYLVKADKLETFVRLMQSHYPTLRELGLATDRSPQFFVEDVEPGQPAMVVEIFEWSSAEAVGNAHTHPAVSRVWEQIAEVLATDTDRPARQHLQARPLALER
jgi:hypothetical protein